jgi:hypothetical protein
LLFVVLYQASIVPRFDLFSGVEKNDFRHPWLIKDQQRYLNGMSSYGF